MPRFLGQQTDVTTAQGQTIDSTGAENVRLRALLVAAGIEL